MERETIAQYCQIYVLFLNLLYNILDPIEVIEAGSICEENNVPPVLEFATEPFNGIYGNHKRGYACLCQKNAVR